MMIIGITGGIGSGKSVICRIFSQLGIPVYEADVEAKKLYDSEPEILQKIREEFSDDVMDKKGKLDKHKLSSLVFGNEQALKKLNKIVHPYVISHFKKWTEKHAESVYVLKEAAILFESGSNKDCDHVIAVAAPVELRIQRTIQRDKRTKQEVEQIIDNQWTDADRIKQSDFIIYNDDQQLVIPQVLDIHNRLLALAHQ